MNNEKMREALKAFIKAMDDCSDYPDTSTDREGLCHSKKMAEQAISESAGAPSKTPDGWYFEFNNKVVSFTTDPEEAADIIRHLEPDETCTEYFKRPAVEPVALGCKQCPHDVGDAYQRDCVYPDCVQTAEEAQPVARVYSGFMPDSCKQIIEIIGETPLPVGTSLHTHPKPEAVRDLVREMKVIQNTIRRQLELISERAPGDFLNKRPVVQALTSLHNRAKAALDAVRLSNG